MTAILPTTPFLVWDTETTGIDPAKDRVVEVAYVLTDLEQVLVSGEHLVNPGMVIPPEASAIHHLVDADVAGAPPLNEVLARIREDLRPWGVSAFSAHNAQFDSAFLPTIKGRPWICTYRLARRLLPDQPAFGNQFLRYALNLQVPEAKGLPAHRALADAFVTAAILRRLVRMALDNAQGLLELGAFAEELEQPMLLKTVGFGKHKGQPWAQVPKSYLRWLLENMKDRDQDTDHTARYYLGMAR